MDFLKAIFFLVIFSTSLISFNASADVTGGETDLSTGVGPGGISILGGGGQLKFDSGDLHFNLTKQFSPADSSNTMSATKHTDNWTGGFEQDIVERFSLALDFDSLNDPNEQLTTTGGKLSATYDIFHLSYRYSEDRINQVFTVGGKNFQGAFIYQSTLEFSVDLNSSDQDSWSPSLAVSQFTPDVSAFSAVLSRQFASSLSNFTDTLQNFEQWAVGLTYSHEFNKLWTAGMATTVSHLVIGKNPSMQLNPTVTRKWGALSAVAGVDYSYTPGTPSYTFNLELKYNFGKDEEEDKEGSDKTISIKKDGAVHKSDDKKDGEEGDENDTE